MLKTKPKPKATLDLEHPTNLESMAATAGHYGLPLWAMLVPGTTKDMFEDLTKMMRLVLLMRNYLDCSDAQRGNIEGMASGLAELGPRKVEPATKQSTDCFTPEQFEKLSLGGILDESMDTSIAGNAAATVPVFDHRAGYIRGFLANVKPLEDCEVDDFYFEGRSLVERLSLSFEAGNKEYRWSAEQCAAVLSWLTFIQPVNGACFCNDPTNTIHNATCGFHAVLDFVRDQVRDPG